MMLGPSDVALPRNDHKGSQGIGSKRGYIVLEIVLYQFPCHRSIPLLKVKQIELIKIAHRCEFYGYTTALSKLLATWALKTT